MAFFVQPSLSPALGFAKSKKPSENVCEGIRVRQKQEKRIQDSEGFKLPLIIVAKILSESCFGTRGSGGKNLFWTHSAGPERFSSPISVEKS